MWTGDLKGYSRSWSNAQILSISNLLLSCNSTKPTDIHRSIRSLKYLRHWKGTEFRTVLLYTGIVVFKNYLSPNEYDLFLRLFCAVTICSTKAYTKFLPVARELFTEINELHIDIYGEHSMTNNLHLLSHIIDDVEHLGDLTTISAYQFENALHQIKIRLKQCDRPLQQIARRLHELSICTQNHGSNLIDAHFPKVSHHVPSRSGDLSFQRIEIEEDVIFSSVNGNIKDRWFLTKDNMIVEFDCVIQTKDGYKIRGCSLIKTDDFFDKPFRSHYINIYLSDDSKNEPSLYDVSVITAKMYCLRYSEKLVFVPLLHSLGL